VSAGALVTGADVARRWPGGGGLAPLDFVLATGEVVALRGRSGTGKTTLLGILAGWIEPDGGTVRFAGPLADERQRRRWEGVAVVPQSLGLLRELSARENVAVAVSPAQASRGAARERADELLAQLELDGLGDRHVDALSLGQRQRVAVARALARRPALLLADEPTSHLDAAAANLVRDALVAHAEQGGTCLVSTHDAAFAADRVIATGQLFLHA
jgi:ABC-type multidrug transport system ATPase subunit